MQMTEAMRADIEAIAKKAVERALEEPLAKLRTIQRDLDDRLRRMEAQLHAEEVTAVNAQVPAIESLKAQAAAAPAAEPPPMRPKAHTIPFEGELPPPGTSRAVAAQPVHSGVPTAPAPAASEPATKAALPPGGPATVPVQVPTIVQSAAKNPFISTAPPSMSAAPPAMDIDVRMSSGPPPQKASAPSPAAAPNAKQFEEALLLLARQPIDDTELPMFVDGARRKRRVAWIMSLLLLLVVGSIVAAAITSQMRGGL